MQSIASALEQLHEDASWFARAHEVRLLVVRTSGDLRATVVSLLPKYEFHHDNRSPWVVLEDGRIAFDDGWIARATRLAAHWHDRRHLSKREGLELGEVALTIIPEGLQEPDRPSFISRPSPMRSAGSGLRMKLMLRLVVTAAATGPSRPMISR